MEADNVSFILSILGLVLSILGFILGLISASEKIHDILTKAKNKTSRIINNNIDASIAKVEILVEKPSLLISYFFYNTLAILSSGFIAIYLLPLLRNTKNIYATYFLQIAVIILFIFIARCIFSLGFSYGHIRTEIKHLILERTEPEQ